MFELHNIKEAIIVSQCCLGRENRYIERMACKPIVINITNIRFKVEHHTEDMKEAEIIISKDPDNAMPAEKKAIFDSNAQM